MSCKKCWRGLCSGFSCGVIQGMDSREICSVFYRIGGRRNVLVGSESSKLHGLPFLVKSYISLCKFVTLGKTYWENLLHPWNIYNPWVSLVAAASELLLICFLTLSMLHATIVMISHLVKKVPSQELLSATELSVRLVW